MNWGVGFAVLGLLLPCTSVWQLVQPRAIMKLMGALPALVPVHEGGCPAIDPVCPCPISCATKAPCGVWHCWHRNGGRDLSMFSAVVPWGLWQLAQFSATGSCVCTNGPRFSMWHV